MIKFNATDKWYKEAAESESGISAISAGIPEGCAQCGGSGEMRVPKTYMTCPCCWDREKFRHCKKCNGTGIVND